MKRVSLACIYVNMCNVFWEMDATVFCFVYHYLIKFSQNTRRIAAYQGIFVLHCFQSSVVTLLHHRPRLYLNRNHLTHISTITVRPVSYFHHTLFSIFLFLFFSNHSRAVWEDYAVSSNPQSLWSAPWSCHVTDLAREPKRGQTTRTWVRRKTMRGLQEE